MRSSIFTIAVNSKIRASAAWLTAARSAFAEVSVAISEAMRLLFGLDRRPLFSHGKDQRMGLGKGRRKFCNGVVIAAITAESRPITQTFQRPDSIRRSLSAHRLRALHNHRTHLRPVQPVNQGEQLRVRQTGTPRFA